jgi:hypothetical protein
MVDRNCEGRLANTRERVCQTGAGKLRRYGTKPFGNCMVMQCKLPFCQINERQGT